MWQSHSSLPGKRIIILKQRNDYARTTFNTNEMRKAINGNNMKYIGQGSTGIAPMLRCYVANHVLVCVVRICLTLNGLCG